MKTRKLFFVAIAACATLFTACKKDDNDKSQAELIQGKWFFDKSISDDFFSGIHHRDTSAFASTDYANFMNNGMVFSAMGTDTSTSVYVVLANSKIVIDGDTSTIQSLTNNNLTIYTKDISGVDYYESTVTLKK